jgi:hypothetical protein
MCDRGENYYGDRDGSLPVGAAIPKDTRTARFSTNHGLVCQTASVGPDLGFRRFVPVRNRIDEVLIFLGVRTSGDSLGLSVSLCHKGGRA